MYISLIIFIYSFSYKRVHVLDTCLILHKNESKYGVMQGSSTGN